MNDRQNPYDPYYQQPQIVGYDEYGQPVYQQQGQQQYDPYAPQQGQEFQQGQGFQQGQEFQQGQVPDQGYGYDPYGQPQQAQQQQQPEHPQYPHQSQYARHPQQYDPYAEQPQQGQGADQGYGYGNYTDYGHGTAQQPVAVDTAEQWNIPHQGAAPSQAQAPAPAAAPVSAPARPAEEPADDPVPEPELVLPEQRRPAADYRTEQFSFIEEPDEDSEDVIDWLKFTESRSERREEARRKGRNRMVALIVVAALVLVGGVGYLWSADMLPGLSGSDGKNGTTAGPQQRDVIVVHLHDTKKGGTSTALLVDNTTTKQGTTVLLPNSLAVASDDGATTTTLGKSVEDDGSTGTRESIDSLLGTRISGTWRLDTPYLENLVELVGNIEIDTDTDVPDAKKGASPLVNRGEAQTLSGPMAVAYATYRGEGEPEAKQLMRFGAVVRGVLRKLSEDPKAATVTVETLAQILDPSLPEQDLGASLAKLAGHAKVGDYKTELLPVQDDGTLSDEATESVVKDILGGAVKAPEEGAPVRVGVRNATGNAAAGDRARVQLVNGGYSYVDGGKADAETSSEVRYRTPEDRAKATEVAKTLGLSEEDVKQGKPAANADVTVVLGQDYKIK
ncbi:LCP family protein [Streptomyces sp. NPDC001787]|uniref:LCP family protein n=1 Tax=Streptomyces sp. NPDC001787 TaxID=3154523 RepID=UPI0033316C9F